MTKNLRKKFDRLRIGFMTSKLGLPLIIIFCIFILAATLVFVFEISENEKEFSSFLDSFWWAIITFSTTGYGDKVPITVGGKIVAIISIFFGLAIISFLSGTMASVFVDRNVQARRGLMDLRRTKDHILICGWKDHMMEILKEILRANTDLTSEDIVIVTNVGEERIGGLKEEQDLKRLRFVKGDYFSESSLARANVKSARKILVLADKLESRAISEVDSKTVITVLTIRTMARDVYICAELLDRKYEHYLKQAMCDEIILIRDYGNLLLANSSSTSGISHIVQNLLDVTVVGSRLTTCQIPKEYIGQAYEGFREYIASTNRLPLGILENTGTPNRMKMQALREAQKTSDVSMLVSNLHEVKNLEVNRPVLHPTDDYVIPSHSRGIILERAETKPSRSRSDGK